MLGKKEDKFVFLRVYDTPFSYFFFARKLFLEWLARMKGRERYLHVTLTKFILSSIGPFFMLDRFRRLVTTV